MPRDAWRYAKRQAQLTRTPRATLRRRRLALCCGCLAFIRTLPLGRRGGLGPAGCTLRASARLAWCTALAAALLHGLELKAPAGHGSCLPPAKREAGERQALPSMAVRARFSYLGILTWGAQSQRCGVPASFRPRICGTSKSPILSKQALRRGGAPHKSSWSHAKRCQRVDFGPPRGLPAPMHPATCSQPCREPETCIPHAEQRPIPARTRSFWQSWPS